MNLTEKYILEYSDGFNFVFSDHLSKRIFDVEIEVDIFEYSAQYSHREKAHVILKKGNLTYECDFCDEHNYENDFYPIILNGQRFIFFRKTLYGFTLINVDTLSIEYEYFPEPVIGGEESFIITEVKQLDNLLIFEGCYWACPYECFAFDYDQKLFLNISKNYDLYSLDKTELQGNHLVLYGTDENNFEKQIIVSKQDLFIGITKYGKTDFWDFAASKADFINKFQIALKECYETDYWLGLFKDTHMITEEEYKDLFAKCSKIRKLLISSITTAKDNADG